MEKKKITLKEIGPKNLIIMFLAGVFLILASFDFNILNSDNNNKQSVQDDDKTLESTYEKDDTSKYIEENEGKLKEALTKVFGVGAVEVMITVNTSKETVTLQDKPYSKETINESDGEGTNRQSTSITNNENTVIINDDSGKNIPYIIKEIEPKIEGVLVIAEGGGDPLVVNEITSAIEVLFGVPVHKIKVVKMNISGG